MLLIKKKTNCIRVTTRNHVFCVCMTWCHVSHRQKVLKMQSVYERIFLSGLLSTFKYKSLVLQKLGLLTGLRVVSLDIMVVTG